MDLSSYGFVDTTSVDESDASSVPSTPGAMNLTPKIMTGDQCCHHFQSQNVFTSEHEPLVLCATDDQVFLATHMANGNCQIEVRCMSDPGCPVLHTFPTITPVKSIIYNKEGQYIATLEEKIRGTQRDTFSHIYLHWDISGDDQPLKARVAGRITDLTGHSDRMNSIEVIEILTKRGPNCIACCEKTGNIAISWGNSVSIFKYIVKMFNNEQYKDFIRIMEIDFNFKTKKCCLNENVLAVCSNHTMQVIRINLSERVPRYHSEAVSQYESQQHDAEYSADSMFAGFEKVPSICRTDSIDFGGKFVSDDYVIVDEAATTWTFVDEDPKATDQGIGQLLPKTVHLPTLQAAVESDALKSQHLPLEVLGPRSYIPGQDAKINIKDEDISMNFESSITTLVFRRLTTLTDNALHTIQLLPVYAPESMDPSLSKRGLRSLNPLKSVYFDKLVSLCFFVSNAKRGYVYNLLGEVKLLCCYPYAEPTQNVALTDTLVHTVTNKGLLTYTGRHFVPALYKLKNFDNIETTCPSPDLDVCLFGTQPFIGIQSVCLTNSHVVLLTKVQHEDNSDEDYSWSMYALKSSMIVALCAEVHELTSTLRHMSPADHVHLLQESQLLIQYAMLHGLEQEEIEQMFKTCCTMLGDYYAMPDHEDWTLTVPYYKMAGMTVPEVIKRHYAMFVGTGGMEFEDLRSLEFGEGLVAYLVHVLFEAGDPFTLEENLGDFVLAAIASKCPQRLAEVIAVSRLKDFSDVHAEIILAELMSKPTKTVASALQKLVRAVLKLRLGEPNDAKIMLTSMSKTDIVSLCTTHHQLLHENLSKWTDLAQLLRSLHRAAFTKILVNLLDKKTIGLNNTVELLQGPEEGAGSNGHVREYLEAVLACDSRKFWFTDAAGMLSKIYLSNLRSQEPPAMRSPEKSHSHLPKGNGHFGKRHLWLNELPPFTGPDCISRPCLYLRSSVRSSSPPKPSSSAETCTCCCCNEDLLKLQSLVCSCHASSSLLHDVLYDLGESVEVKGRDSLQILCLAQTDPLSTTDKILQTFPLVLPQFSKQMLGEDSHKWAYVAEKVTTLLRQNSEKKDLYKKIYEGLLTEMSEILPLKEFLRLLPADGNLGFFVPYMEKSYRSSATCGLKEKIIHNGETLYSGSLSLSW
ncbi:BLOC-2 complex member HPS3-like isoform X2 [Lineus longissimus]|uniref:BLOC-2 complex member HPS3-like isoform X2 n=1 Tax=Lineus longissimus TaxID=88925 RepID=UPI00315DC9EB